MPFSELEHILVKDKPTAEDLAVNPLYLPPGSESRTFRSVWIMNMREAMKRGAFPWSNRAIKAERSPPGDVLKVAPEE